MNETLLFELLKLFCFPIVVVVAVAAVVVVVVVNLRNVINFYSKSFRLSSENVIKDVTQNKRLHFMN